MTILLHPSVAGWKAFHQSPQFYNVWINSVSLPKRERTVNLLIDGVMVGRQMVKIDTTEVISKLSNPSDPNALISDLTQVLFPFPVSKSQIDFLKNILIPGLPDFEWTVEYSEYLADPNDEGKSMAIENKLESLFKAILKMPENYLI